MKYMLLSLVLYFYQLIIFDKVRCTEDGSNKDNTIDQLKDYDIESTSIRVENKSLTMLSHEILKFTKLEHLCLKYNQFTEIASYLSKIKTLETLDMNNNVFQDFPSKIILEHLRCLFLSYNEITFGTFSDSKDNTLNLNDVYPKFEILDLSHNKIEYIPNLRSRTLQRLYLCSNKITTIDSKMFSGLTELNFLGLTYNNLRQIDNNIGELKNLNSIDLFNNKISTFILNKNSLPNLVFLDLGHNQITEFELTQSTVPQITILSLSNNGLFEIPSDIYDLRSLEILDLTFNNITKIPYSISKLTNLKILKLYKNKLSQISNFISKLTKLENFIVSFEYLDHIPDCIIDMIRDYKYYNITYKKYIESQTNDSKNLPKKIEKRKTMEIFFE